MHLTMQCGGIQELKSRSIYTYRRGMACLSAQLSNMAHIGYMGMFGPWRSPNQYGASVLYLKHHRLFLGAPIEDIGTNQFTMGTKMCLSQSPAFTNISLTPLNPANFPQTPGQF